MEKINSNFYKQIDELKNTLLSKLSNCDKVFIFPHNEMDFDALASAIALSEICNFFGIDNYIVTNDKFDDEKSSISRLFLELRETYNFINSKTFNAMRNDDDLFIVTDSCVKNLMPVNDIEAYNNEIIVIDHHNPDDKVIKTDNLFINNDACSASEILFFLMKSLDIYITEEVCQLLLAGIYLDTNGLNYMHNPSGKKSYNKLLQYGANLDVVKGLFAISNRERKIVDELIGYNSIYHDYQGRTFAIAFNKGNPDMVYTDKQLACACDSLLQSSADVVFVIGHIMKEKNNQSMIAVKARSKVEPDAEDVSAIMQLFDGGGDTNRAACMLSVSDILETKDEIKKVLKSEPDKRNKEYILTKKD